MKPSDGLVGQHDSVNMIVAAHHAGNARIFGSVVSGEDIDGNDLDIPVDPDFDMTAFDIGALRFQLEKLLGVPVDVVTPKSLPEAIRETVLREARAL